MAKGLIPQPAGANTALSDAAVDLGARETEYHQAFLSTVDAGRGEQRIAHGVILLSAIGFIAAAPFAAIPLLKVNAFIPAYESALVLLDAITAVMLFGQFRWSRSTALLVLAAGFLYDALLIIAHALTFPGAFSPTGLLAAGTQTTAWLYMFWHGGFSLFLIGYAVLADRAARASGENQKVSPSLVGVTVATTVVVAALATVLAISGDTTLPAIMAGNVDRLSHKIVVSFVWTTGMIAVAVLWRRRQTLLDLWLIVVACAWVFDVGLSAVFDAARFDLGFYAGRAYGLLATSFVLGALLVETGGLHHRLAGAKALVDDYAHRLEERVRERTAQLEAETEERQKAEALLHQSQKMEALGQLTGGLAHDFNNHLGIIIGNLDLLGDQSELSADQRELVEEALTAAFSGAELTRRLLAFARRQPLRPARVEVNKLIAEFTKLLGRTLGEQVQIELHLDPNLPAVVVDPSQLETTIANLANNARDAMPHGGRLTITTGTRYLDADYAAEHVEVTPGGYVLIEVSDTGSGMPPEIAAHVFEPFFTTKGTGKGTGLGLSMVFGFLKQSRGHINVYSEVGRGTTFRLYLPPAEALAEDMAVPSIDGRRLAGAAERILVVEDNERLRLVLVRQLHELGYRVIEVDNAVAARELINTGAEFDLLLTDVIMPGAIDGYQLTQEFIASRPGARVLLTSGFPGTRIAELEGIGSELRLLSKPYRKQELARILREVLTEPPPSGD